ncbi:MAG: hypothetical protein ABI390_05750 [Daejeonella sp.]
MNKIILSIFLLLVAVFTFAYLYFSNIEAGSKNNNRALSQIPASASLIFSFKNDDAFYEIFKDYELFDAITGKENKAEFEIIKNNLLNLKQINEVSNGQPVFLSFHPQEKDSISFLWTLPLKSKIESDDLLPAFNQENKISSKYIDANGIKIAEIQFAGTKKPFYLYTNKSVANGSFSKNLLLQVLNANSPKISDDFIEEINSGSLKNDNSAANVFVNLTTGKEFLNSFFRDKKANGNFNLLSNLSGFSTLNMNFKNDALMFNGITKTDSTTLNYLNLFLHQKAVKNPITRIVPANTAYFIAFGLSNYSLFNKDLRNFYKSKKELGKLDEVINTISKETGIQANRDIQKYWGNEFVIFQLSTREKLGAIKLTNGRKLQFFMEPLSTVYSENIWRLNYPELFTNYFGEPFKQFNAPFYTIIDNYLITSNSPGSLQRFLSNYNAGKQLYSNSNFTAFNRLVADESNISIYLNVKNSYDNINSLLKRSYSKNIKSDEFGYKKFYGISYQWSSDGDHFFTNFYAASKQLVETAVTKDTLIVNQ